MIIEGLHEKGIFTERYPFRLTLNTAECFDYPLHWHSAVELVYAVENEYAVHVAGKRYHLSERDLLLIAGGDIHGFHTQNNRGKRFFIQFDISRLDGFGDIHAVKPFLSQTIKISRIEERELHTALEEQVTRMIAEYDQKAFAHALYLNARIYDILVILSRSLLHKAGTEKAGPGTNKAGGMERLERAFQYIEAHYQNDISLKDVSRATGFSAYHFSRLFKEITEKNFRRFLNEYRVQKAEKLLMRLDTPIIQVALASGFNSAVTFNRVFKEVKDYTPSAYRKMQV